MRNVDLDTYNRLVSDLYAAALEPSGWQTFVERLGEVHAPVLPAIHGHDVDRGVILGLVSAKFDPDFLDSYVSHYGALNPWVEGMSRSRVGDIDVAEKMISKRDLTRTEFYNDWIKPQGDIGTGSAVVLVREERRILSVCGNIPFDAPVDVHRGWAELLEALAPHIKRAFDMQRVIDRTGGDEGATAAFDKVERVAFLLDRRGRVVECNALAETFLAGSDLLHLDASKVLCCARPEADRRMKRSLARIVNRSGQLDAGVFVLGTRAGEHVHTAMLTPYKEQAERWYPFEAFGAERAPVALLIVGLGRMNAARLERVARDAFDLTAAEAALLTGLSEGQSLQEYAAARGLSIHTVRTQLKAVFAKTKVTRQGELVALASRLTVV